MNARAATPSYIVVTPVRNEGAHLGYTIASMVAQTTRPVAWVLVDDGSTDDTPGLIKAAAAEHPWIRMVRRADRGARKPGGGVVEAFYDGFRLVESLPWDFAVKLDGDLSFEPDYFERCFQAFAADPRLGIAGGTILVRREGTPQVEFRGDPRFHVRGATKIYRRACWLVVSPLLIAPGWDTLDEVKANQSGWVTRTLADVSLVQRKETGSADGSWRNWFKNGVGCYNSGYDLMFMSAKCAKRALGRPFLVPGLALAAGYVTGALRGLPGPSDRPALRFLRRQQRRRLVGLSSIYD